MDATNNSTLSGIKGATRRLCAIVERAGEAIAILGLDDEIRYANTAWVRMHGYGRVGELVGKHISLFHTEEQMQTDVAPFMEEAKRRGHFTGPIEHMRSDGTTLPTETTMCMVKDREGNSLGIIVFATDTSEREVMRQQLRALRSQVKEKGGELRSVEERLVREVSERARLEQCLDEQTTELKEARQTTERQCDELSIMEKRLAKLHGVLERKTAEEHSLKEQLQREIAERQQMESLIKEQRGELALASEHLKEEVTQLKRREVEYLDDMFGADGGGPKLPGLDSEELDALSKMAKKFVEA